MKRIKIIFPIGSLFPDESGGVSICHYWMLKGVYSTHQYDLVVISTMSGIKKGLLKENTWIDSDYGRVIYLRTFKKNNSFTYRDSFKIIKIFLNEIHDTDIVHLVSIFNILSIPCFFI